MKTAALAGKALPETDPVRPVAEELELVKGRVDGFTDAVADQELACVAAFESDRAGFLKAALARRDDAVSSYAAAIEALLEARRAFVSTLHDMRWIETFPERNISDSQPDSIILDATVLATGLVGFDGIAQALRKDADLDERLKARPQVSTIGGGHMPVPRDADGKPNGGARETRGDSRQVLQGLGAFAEISNEPPSRRRTDGLPGFQAGIAGYKLT